MESSASVPQNTVTFNKRDILFIVFTIVMVLFGFFEEWKFTIPYTDVASDISNNVLTAIVAEQYPENFHNDFLLRDPSVFTPYQTILTLFIRLVDSFVNDLGLSVLILTIPIIIIHNIGYYFLGLTVSKNRLLALAFVVAITQFNVIALGEVWGVTYDPLPRLIFQALLPYLLICAIRWRNTPSKWVWLMIGAGLLVYIHSVSTPAWGFAIWLGLWLCHPPHWSWGKRLAVMLGLGIVFVLTLSPFAVNYLTSFKHGRTFDIDLIKQISEIRILEGYYDVELAVQLFYNTMLNSYFTPPLLLLGFIVLPVLSHEWRKRMLLILAWVIAILLISVGLMWLDHSLADTLRRLPVQVDLIRGMRYLIPLGYLIVLIIASYLAQRISLNKQATYLYYTAILIAIGAMSFPHLQTIPGTLEDLNKKWNKGIKDSELVNYFLEETDPLNTSVLFIGNPTAYHEIRYKALRSIAFLYKDGGILAYGDSERLVIWFNLWNTIDGIAGTSDEWVRYNHLLQQINANYIFRNRYDSRLANLTSVDPLREAGFRLGYTWDDGIVIRMTKPLPYDEVFLSEFSQQINHDHTLEVYCNPDGVELRDASTSGTLAISYEKIDQSITEQFPFQIASSDILSLSRLTDTILRADLGEQSHYLFSLYRCNFSDVTANPDASG